VILRKIFGIILVIVGVAGLALPVIPGILFIVLGALLFSGRNPRAVYRKLRSYFNPKRRASP
jgi:uncharacterized membrane protein YbaN (DUF454 family)